MLSPSTIFLCPLPVSPSNRRGRKLHADHRVDQTMTTAKATNGPRVRGAPLESLATDLAAGTRHQSSRIRCPHQEKRYGHRQLCPSLPRAGRPVEPPPHECCLSQSTRSPHQFRQTRPPCAAIDALATAARGAPNLPVVLSMATHVCLYYRLVLPFAGARVSGNGYRMLPFCLLSFLPS